MTFVEILKDLIQEKGINIAILSEATGIDKSVLYDQLNGSMPRLNHAIILSNYFDCSLNYLFGLDFEQKYYKNYKNDYNISLFLERYNSLLKENKTSHYSLCRKTGLNESSYYAWRNGSSPAINSLIIIAEYFEVSIDYLIGRCDEI